MSSGFVSGGTVDNPTERDDEWRQAQAELEAARKAKADLAAQHDGKSLFEVLQENKDKKQAEFEERARYKLHVSLNDEEADYLDSIEEKRRKEEAKVKRDTQEQLEIFRRQQEEDMTTALEADNTGISREQVKWAAAGRKRKKAPENGLLKGVKLRKAGSNPEESLKLDPTLAVYHKTTPSADAAGDLRAAASKYATTPRPVGSTSVLSLGLGYASSEDEDDES